MVKSQDNEYDSNGNPTKGYETIKMTKRQVLDLKYSDNGQLMESKGGPVNPGNIQSKDIRHDGLAHLFYVYDAEGLLTEIKKYERDKATGEEKLTAIEKLIYKKY